MSHDARPDAERDGERRQADAARRRLLTALATGGVVTAKTLPEQWLRPMVDAVLLPTHAQATGAPAAITITCVPPSCSPGYVAPGQPLPQGSNYCFAMQITPNPGAVPVTIQGFCNGVLWSSFSPNNTDASGLVSLGVAGFAGSPCTPGQTYSVRVSYQGVTGECSWPVVGAQETNCLLHGTPVLLADGRLLPVEDLEPGMLAAAHGARRFSVVTRVVRNHLREAYFTINGALRITGDHPVLVRAGGALVWKPVASLRTGEELGTQRGFAPLRSLTRHDVPAQTVYVETHTGDFVAVAGAVPYVIRSSYAAMAPGASAPARALTAA